MHFFSLTLLNTPLQRGDSRFEPRQNGFEPFPPHVLPGFIHDVRPPFCYPLVVPESKADKLAAVLAGDSRYGIEIDSALRTIGHALPADFCLKWFSGLDDSAPSFRESVMTMIQVAEKISGEKLYDISFDDTSEDEIIPPTEEEFKVPVRIHFRDEQAAYYQYHLFPPELDYITGYSRKRDGASQVLILSLRSRKHLDDFIAVCRSNPHFVSIEQISEEEFWKAPSHGV